jgi:hypothetical protein
MLLTAAVLLLLLLLLSTTVYFLLSDCKSNHIVQIAYLPSGWNCLCCNELKA